MHPLGYTPPATADDAPSSAVAAAALARIEGKLDRLLRIIEALGSAFKPLRKILDALD